MSQRTVYFNGQFVPESQARVSIYDSALLVGDMAYEVTRTFRHQPFRLEQHLHRLYESLAAIETVAGMTPGELHDVTLQTLERNLPTEDADVDWQIIHNVSRGPSLEFVRAFEPSEMRASVIVSCYPIVDKLAALAPAYESGVNLIVTRQRAVPGEWLRADIKTRSRLHYQLASLEARQRQPGAYACLVDPAGHVMEGTNGNLFIVRDGRLITCPTGSILEGVTRGVVLELAGRLGIAASEEHYTVPQALEADEVFLTSTSIGILHARSLDGQMFGEGQLGTVTSRLREALWEEVGLDISQQARHYASLVAQHP